MGSVVLVLAATSSMQALSPAVPQLAQAGWLSCSVNSCPLQKANMTQCSCVLITASSFFSQAAAETGLLEGSV